ncbi:transcription-repair coupling factor [Actinotignum urinale]|uniref:transcription-repair coupling factor n=1 Tax=Actinotignum urinale TaxID=190146 RepID=UPI00280BAB8A|nr:transcription-repair coupling factor [Actinotignum urinale]
MDLRPLLSLVSADTAVSNALENASATTNIAMPRGFLPLAVALCCEGKETPLNVVVTASGRDAQQLSSALAPYMATDQVEVFPAWETLPHERLSPRSDTVAQRLLVLRRLAHPEEFDARLRVLIMPVRALLQPITAGLGELAPVRLRVGEEYPMEEVEEALVGAAYSRVDMVERRGQFAVRGGILDVFPPTESHPLRIEFFGDEVEDIRAFAVADQRSMDTRKELYAPACREILLTSEVRQRARVLMEKLPGALDMLDSIVAGIAPEGMESLTPLLVDRMQAVADTFPEGTRVIIAEPERVEQRAESLLATTQEFLTAAWSSAVAGGKVPIQAGAANFASVSQTRAHCMERGFSWWTFGGFDTRYAVHAREPLKFLGKMDAAMNAMKEHARQSWKQVLVVDGPGLARRYADQLGEYDIASRLALDLPEQLTPGIVYVTVAPISEGFVMEGAKFALFAASDITGRGGSSTRDMRTLPKRRTKKTVDPLSLKPGDFVVHDHHGVAKFVRMEKRSVGHRKDNQREYLVLEYAPTRRGAPGDQLWVPTDQLDHISKYSGGEAPKLNKMGGIDWEKTKSRARAATRRIASELIRLYASRVASKGIPFSPDTPWQRELEDAFPFQETADQLHTIDEVKTDMEKPTPMDRLISGDVGYGKTEIAVRAAFKAVQDGYQVAILVPTTLLVDQHRETFEERYAGFPVTVGSLSRFQTAKESAQVVNDLASGKIDVVIGTHKLLTGNVRFKKLGLVVIDEEQRFGVEHKETLKQMYPNIDVLSMSATPIPRTLEMAVTGVREMSTLATPPEERHPILTYVGARENKQIKAAIRRELLRDGQIFYVHNRVTDMDRIATQIKSLVPEARVGIAHGQMGERQLENIIESFWNKDIDVLICTTIVETGLDISNANTLIVDNADKMGLSQLHQLRGRVGRGRERAYAYFLYEPGKALTQTALERLRTIATNTDLGAGTQVAMKDLEIRGAGNMLGGEQSGHIEGVGFDLYVRMVSEAVAKIRGEMPDEDEAKEIRVELPVEAFLPEDYVPSERLRLEIYTKLAGTRSNEEREEIRGELVDRYGKIPEVVDRLFAIAELRDLARSVGIEEITVVGRNIRLSPVELPDSRQARLKRLYPGALLKPAIRVLLVPMPVVGGKKLGQAQAVEGEELISWVERLITSVFIASIG